MRGKRAGRRGGSSPGPVPGERRAPARLPLALLRPALALLLLLAQSGPGCWGGGPGVAAAADPERELADLDLPELARIRVSPFEVSSRLDSGYRASNAVSASRFDVPIGELPFAIQVFTESFIRDQKPVQIFDVARYSPGVTYRSNDFNEGNANLAIRGFAVGSLPAGNIQMLRDGFHGPSIFDFTNISRVEVVKGPASFLYGQLAPGGIVNVITKSPLPEFAAWAEARYGSYGQYRYEADLTGPASRTLFYRMAGSYDHDLEYWVPYQARSWDLAPSLLWQPSSRVSLTLKYESFHKDETPQLMQKPGYDTQAGLLPTPADPNRSGVEVPGLPGNWNSMSHADFRRSDTSNPSAWIDWSGGEHWNLRTGYSHLEYRVDALFSGNFGMANNSTFLQGRRFRRQVYQNRDDTFQSEALGHYDLGWGSVKLLLGGQYVERGLHRRAAQAPNDPALGSDPIASPLPLWDLSDPSTWNREVAIPLSALTADRFDESVSSQDRSLYGGATLALMEQRLLLLAGWRWTSTRSRFSDNLQGGAQPRSGAAMMTPQYGVLYKLAHDFSLYASYSESFVPWAFPLTNQDGTKSPAKPSRGRGYELGVKGGAVGGRLSGTLTCFDIRNSNIVNDLAVTRSSGSVLISNVQSGEQRSRGVELDASARLSEDWQLYLSYSYTRARITEFSGNDSAILAQDPATLDAAGQANYKNVRRFHDAPLQMSAPHLANLWTRYDFSGRPLRGVHLAGGFNLVRQQTLLPDSPESSRQNYLLLHATLGYTLELAGRQLSAELSGKNLTDQQYRPSQSTRSRPREFLFTLRGRF